jgi:hypothetical protein
VYDSASYQYKDKAKSPKAKAKQKVLKKSLGRALSVMTGLTAKFLSLQVEISQTNLPA